MRAGDRLKRGKECLLHENLNLDSQDIHKKLGVVMHIVTPVLGWEGDRKISGAFWSASLAGKC